ncbi:MAG: hypothetical protein ACE5KV_03465 [Thermoplasmata archaeon]
MSGYGVNCLNPFHYSPNNRKIRPFHARAVSYWAYYYLDGILEMPYEYFD